MITTHIEIIGLSFLCLLALAAFIIWFTRRNIEEIDEPSTLSYKSKENFN